MLNATDEKTGLARGLGCVIVQGHYVHCLWHNYFLLEHVPQGVKTMLCISSDLQNVAISANNQQEERWSRSFLVEVVCCLIAVAACPNVCALDLSCSLLVPNELVARREALWIATWLILPVVIRSSQRLSHACLSINLLLWNCERLIISVIVYLIVPYYLDNRSNSRANTCVNTLLG